jgi:hypothetical protein
MVEYYKKNKYFYKKYKNGKTIQISEDEYYKKKNKKENLYKMKGGKTFLLPQGSNRIKYPDLRNICSNFINLENNEIPTIFITLAANTKPFVKENIPPIEIFSTIIKEGPCVTIKRLTFPVPKNELLNDRSNIITNIVYYKPYLIFSINNRLYMVKVNYENNTIKLDQELKYNIHFDNTIIKVYLSDNYLVVISKNKYTLYELTNENVAQNKYIKEIDTDTLSDIDNFNSEIQINKYNSYIIIVFKKVINSKTCLSIYIRNYLQKKFSIKGTYSKDSFLKEYGIDIEKFKLINVFISEYNDTVQFILCFDCDTFYLIRSYRHNFKTIFLYYDKNSETNKNINTIIRKIYKFKYGDKLLFYNNKESKEIQSFDNFNEYFMLLHGPELYGMYSLESLKKNKHIFYYMTKRDLKLVFFDLNKVQDNTNIQNIKEVEIIRLNNIYNTPNQIKNTKSPIHSKIFIPSNEETSTFRRRN